MDTVEEEIEFVHILMQKNNRHGFACVFGKVKHNLFPKIGRRLLCVFLHKGLTAIQRDRNRIGIREHRILRSDHEGKQIFIVRLQLQRGEHQAVVGVQPQPGVRDVRGGPDRVTVHAFMGIEPDETLGGCVIHADPAVAVTVHINRCKVAREAHAVEGLRPDDLVAFLFVEATLLPECRTNIHNSGRHHKAVVFVKGNDITVFIGHNQ